MADALTDCIPEDSWFLDWLGSWPLVESPTSFILFAGYSILGAVLGRSCWIDHDQRKLWPMLNTLFIGPSGIGKTTALELGIRDLLGYLPANQRPAVIEGTSTPEKLYDDLAIHPHTILYAEELAAYFNRQRYNESLIPMVTELLNYKPTMERRTKAGGVTVIHMPAAVVLGASTKEWLQKQLPDAAVAGGFLARFLVVAEEYKRQRVPLPSMALTKKQKLDLDHHRLNTAQSFLGIVGAIAGPIRWYDFVASDAYADWYNTHQPASGHLAPFAARAGEFVQRLAMLTAVSRNQDYITAKDITCGIKLYEYATKRLQSVVVPYSRDGELLSKVLECIGTGTLDDITLRRQMRNTCSAQEADRLVTSLMASGDLTRLDSGRLRRTNAK